MHSKVLLYATALLMSLPSFAEAVTQAPADAIDLLKPGEWYDVPNSHLRSVVPVPTPCGSPGAIMGAWSGGAYDSNNDRLLVWGGGHADYGGNELYAFSVRSLNWSRIWGPSPDIACAYGTACVDTYSDGNPVARHTYNGLNFLPAQNAFWIYGGSLYCGAGDAGNDTWFFDLAAGRWQRKVDLPIPTYAAPLGVATAYDAVTGHVFLSDPAGYWLYEYDPVANAYTLRSSQGGGATKSGVVDTKRRKLILVGGGQVVIYDLNLTGSIPRQIVSTTGATNAVGVNYPGLAYDPVSDRVVAWAGGAQVYSLNMDTLVWTRLDPAPTNTVVPTGPADTGTFGRFRYIPSKNAFITVSDIDQDVFIYKLSAGGGVSDSTAPSPPQNLRTR